MNLDDLLEEAYTKDLLASPAIKALIPRPKVLIFQNYLVRLIKTKCKCGNEDTTLAGVYEVVSNGTTRIETKVTDWDKTKPVGYIVIPQQLLHCIYCFKKDYLYDDQSISKIGALSYD